MEHMRVVQVGKPRGDRELVERDIAETIENQIRIKVEACVVCNRDK